MHLPRGEGYFLIKGHGILAVLVRNKISILATFVSNRVWFFYTLVLNSGHGFWKKLVFMIIDKTINKRLLTKPF